MYLRCQKVVLHALQLNLRLGLLPLDRQQGLRAKASAVARALVRVLAHHTCTCAAHTAARAVCPSPWQLGPEEALNSIDTVPRCLQG